MQCPPAVLLQRLTERARTSDRDDDKADRINKRVESFKRSDFTALIGQLSKNQVYEVRTSQSSLGKGSGANKFCHRSTALVRLRRSRPSSGNACGVPLTKLVVVAKGDELITRTAPGMLAKRYGGGSHW